MNFNLRVDANALRAGAALQTDEELVALYVEARDEWRRVDLRGGVARWERIELRDAPAVAVLTVLRDVPERGRRREMPIARAMILPRQPGPLVLRDWSRLRVGQITRAEFELRWDDDSDDDDGEYSTRRYAKLYDGNSALIHKRFEDYERVEERLTPAQPIFAEMRVRTYPLASDLVVPAMYFHLAAPSPRDDAAFYEHTCITALRLRRMSADEFVRAVRDARARGAWRTYDAYAALNVVVTMFTFVANSMDYMSDRTVGGRLAERFVFVRNGFYAGDCEDSANECLVQVRRFQELARTSNAHRALSPQLHAAALVLTYYVPMAVTGAVSSAQATHDGGGDEQLWNHYYGALMPRRRFLDALRLNTAEKQRLVEAFAREAPFQAWEETMPLRILEGTNYSSGAPEDPLRYTADARQRHANERSAVARTQEILRREWPDVLEHYSWEITQERVGFGAAHTLSLREYSSFYQYPITVMTDLRHYGNSTLCDLRVVTRDTQTYGVDFRDFVERSERLEFVPTVRIDAALVKATRREQARPMAWRAFVEEPLTLTAPAPAPAPVGAVQLRARGAVPPGLVDRVGSLKNAAGYTEEWSVQIASSHNGETAPLELHVLEIGQL